MLKASAEETVTEIFGTTASKALLLNIQLPSSDAEITRFQDDLGTILGTCSKVVERAIVRDLYKRLRLQASEDINFEREILRAAESLTESKAA